jgi:hypothetical protein
MRAICAGVRTGKASTCLSGVLIVGNIAQFPCDGVEMPCGDLAFDRRPA